MSIQPTKGLYGFSQNDFNWYKGLVLHELVKVPLDVDTAVIKAALNTLIKKDSPDSVGSAVNEGSPDSNDPLASAPEDLKYRISQIKYFLDNPEEYVQDPEQHKNFFELITDCVRARILWLDNISAKEKEEMTQSLQSERKNAKTFGKTLAEQRTLPVDPEKMTEDLNSYFTTLVKKGEYALEWEVGDRVKSDSVINHYLTLNNYISREEFLKLTVSQLLRYGDPSKEPLYREAKKGVEGPLGIEKIKQLVQEQDKSEALKKIDEKSSVAYHLYASLPLMLQSDPDIILAAMRHDPRVFKIAPEDQKNDPKLVREAIKIHYDSFNYASAALKANLELALDFVQQAYQQTGKADVALNAVKHLPSVLENLPEKLKSDRTFMLAAIRTNKDALQQASDDLRKDQTFLLDAIQQNSNVLQDLPDDLKKDRNFILKAVEKNGKALQHAPTNLKGDREIALKAIKQSDFALPHVDASLFNDREFILEAVRHNELVFSKASDELKNDKEIVLEVVKQDGLAFVHASNTLKDDRKFVLSLLDITADIIQHASEKLRSSSEVMLKALNKDWKSFNHASEDLRQDPSFFSAYIRANYQQTKSPQIYLNLMSQNLSILTELPQELKSNKIFILNAMEQNAKAFTYASEDLKKDRKFILEVIERVPEAFAHLPEEFRDDPEMISMYAASIDGRDDQWGRRNLPGTSGFNPYDSDDDDNW